MNIEKVVIVENNVEKTTGIRKEVDMIFENFVISGKGVKSQRCCFIKISNKLLLKIKPHIDKSILYINAILVRANGAPVEIPELFRSFFLQYLIQDKSNSSKYKYYYLNSVLLIQESFKFNPVEGVNQTEIQKCIENIKTIFPVLIKALNLIGLNSKFSKYSIAIKKNQLILLETIHKLVNKEIKQPLKLPTIQKIPEKGCVFRFCKSINELQQSQVVEAQQSTSIKTGGYFQIQKKFCSVQEKEMQQPQIVQLAVKQLRDDQKKQNRGCDKRNKQFRIINQIQDKKHSLQYWRFQDDLNSENKKIYMDYVSETLYHYIYSGSLTIQNFIDFSSQIIDGVSILHSSGIVHRDLKPDNILIETKNDKKNVKIIDFGESALFSDQFKAQSKYLGATVPYSPIQCIFPSIESFNSQQIDLWSIGVILFQLYYKKSPLAYSKCFSLDINQGWRMPENFSIFPYIRKQKGAQFTSYFVSILTSQSICIEQSERMKLNKMAIAIKYLRSFLLSLFYC